MDFGTIVLFFLMRGENMPLSFAICDDSPTDRELIASLNRQWAAQTNTVVKLSEFTSAENYLIRAPEEGSPDILLLDIEMGAMDGISLAKIIQQSNNTIYLLLLTNLNGFLILVVTLTSVAGFLVNRNVSQWEYLHKDEKRQFWKHTDYIEKKTRSMEAAKDIRIFGLGPWLNEIHDGVLRPENVTFRYPGTDTNLFEHLNLTIRPGEKVAVVGLNGAGKTTLVKLLCCFCDPDEGRVLLNGTDIREYNRQDYYKLLCAVYQDYSVLDVTVAENVAQQQENIDIHG